MAQGQKKPRVKRIIVGIAVFAVAVAAFFSTQDMNSHVLPYYDGLPRALDSSYDDQFSTKIEGAEITSENIFNYVPGQYGDIVITNESEIDAMAADERESFLENWHDRAWHQSEDETVRYVTASYADDPDVEFAAGEVIVAFGPSVSYSAVAEYARQRDIGIGDVRTIAAPSSDGSIEDCTVAVFYWDDLTIDPLTKALELLAADPDLKAAFPNLMSSVFAGSSSANTTFSLDEQKYLTVARFDKAWDVVRPNGDVEVAVIDTGVDMDHPDLAGNIDYDNAYDAINRCALSSDFADGNGHGTIVSGIVSAVSGNGMGIEGCSGGATILPIRAGDAQGNFDVWAIGEAMGHLFDLEDKPDVVNMSFGLNAESWGTLVGQIVYGTMIQGQINELSDDYGVVFVAAAGNDGREGSPVAFPAALQNVLSVASVDEKNLTKSDFSNANSTVDICAVGNPTLSTTDPTSEFASFKNYYADTYYPLGSASASDGRYIKGTSFSAPQVAAAAAMIKAQHADWHFDDVKDRLISTATKLDAMGAAERTDEYGYGLLDAAAAVGYKDSASGGSGGSGSPYTGGSLRSDA